ncbi:hypothetical protein CPB86DRAFT_867531 [Serendipita vermifera]|nr:hypothetical protein CPB86DRAFT_867531 [Serendipita vermifera]
MPPKRRLENGTLPHPKKVKTSNGDTSGMHYTVATFEDAERVREDPPVPRLQEAIRQAKKEQPAVGSSVVYWMRMEDMRIDDNRAFSAASAFAKKHGIPVIVLFLFSPGDYKAHGRGPRRIDFTLRNLYWLKDKLDRLNIPLYGESHTPRKSLPQKVIELVRSWGSKSLYANLEYEIDEVRRDLQVLEQAKEWGVYCDFYEDKLIVPPYKVSTMQGKQFSVYSPWLRAWKAYVDGHPECLAEASAVQANASNVRNDTNLGPLFEITIPNSLPGFELEDAAKMEELWPAGTEAARDILHRFLATKYRKGQLDVSPLNKGSVTVDKKDTRLGKYGENRAKVDGDTSSRISPYLAAGVISVRELVRESMKFLGVKKVNVERENGAGVWVQEIGWRDFYSHVLAAFPHVSMGRPFNEKYANVRWETDMSKFEAWRDGMTGFPIVDAAMRQLKTQGWIHNRTRMIVAMFLTKDLMIDWRLGEAWFMQQLIDADLANNNGGWQWSASTGTDPQPYFRVFNPVLQSEKADPTGDFIRHFVPELKNVKGKAIHEPFQHLSEAEFKKLGYSKPICDHKESRERAVRRYQNPGSK